MALQQAGIMVRTFCLLLVPSLLSAGEPPVSSPGFLILMADNWAWPHAGACGDPVVKTPAFDNLVREGVLFRNAFCVCPSCSPARAAFLTGQTIHRLGDAANLYSRFPAELKIFTRQLEEAGYVTGYSGKGWAPGNFRVSGLDRNPAGDHYRNAEAFLKNLPADKPFCYWYSSRHPHIPWEDGSEMKGKLDPSKVMVPDYLPDTPEIRNNICDYLCEVQLFDQECAEILSCFREAGRLSGTVVLMTSDNGWQMPHGLAHIYDAGTRIPLVISWPGHFPAGVSEEFVNFDDLAPTILQLAQAEELPDATGTSLVPVLSRDAAQTPRDHVFLSRERHANVRRGDRSYPVRAIRTRDFLYVRNFEPELWPAGDPEMYFAVGDFGDVDFTATKKFVLDHQHEPQFERFFAMNFGKRPAVELYDLARDPYQTVNVASAPGYESMQLQLADRLQKWMVETKDPRVLNPHDDRWDKAVYYGGPPKQR